MGSGMYTVRNVHDTGVGIYVNRLTSFLCAHNYYLAGVDSYYDNHHKDRRSSFLCCNSPGHYSGHCYITGYQNSWDGYMDFRAQHNREFITGVFSYHDNHGE